MLSQSNIFSNLTEIANKHNLKGEGVDLQISWLTYLFGNQSV